MTRKNSLTRFKKAVVPILPAHEVSAPAPAAATGDDRGRTGPKPKPAAEKRSRRVMLSMTPREAELSKRRAGLAGEATVILAFLKQHGYFEDET